MTDAYEDEGPGVTALHDHFIRMGLAPRPEKELRDDEKQWEDIKINQQLKELYRNELLSLENINKKLEGDKNDEDEDDNDDDKDDEEFLEQLRRQRLKELSNNNNNNKSNSNTTNSTVPLIEISKFDDEVLSPSASLPVIMAIIRPSPDPASTSVINSLCLLIKKYPSIKILSVYATEEIKNFPFSHAPALLCYRNKKMIQQWSRFDLFSASIGNNNYINSDIIEYKLSQANIIESDIEEDPSIALRKESTRKLFSHINNNGKNKYQNKSIIRKGGDDNNNNNDDDDDIDDDDD